jgi:hypothetical protein
MVTEARQVAPVSTAWNGREARAQQPAIFHHAPSDGLVEDNVPLVNMAHGCANRVVQRLKIPRPGNTGKQEVGILQDSSRKRLVD